MTTYTAKELKKLKGHEVANVYNQITGRIISCRKDVMIQSVLEAQTNKQ